MVPSYRPLGQLMGLFILFLCPLIRAPMPITSRSEPIAAFHSRTLDPSLRVGAPVVSLNFLSPWLFPFPFLSLASFFDFSISSHLTADPSRPFPQKLNFLSPRNHHRPSPAADVSSQLSHAFLATSDQPHRHAFQKLLRRGTSPSS